MDADGNNCVQLTDNPKDDMRPFFSPDMKTVIFNSNRDGNIEIYTMNTDGTNQKRLMNTKTPQWKIFPNFSPDGKMIAYVEDKELGSAGGGLWIVPANGGLPKLVADAGNASTPIWSPDGRMVAFVDYAAAKKIHIVQLGPEGNPAGEQVSIDCPQEISEVRRLVGWTPDNVIGAVVGTPIEFSLYAQPVDGGNDDGYQQKAYSGPGGFSLPPYAGADDPSLWRISHYHYSIPVVYRGYGFWGFKERDFHFPKWRLYTLSHPKYSP